MTQLTFDDIKYPVKQPVFHGADYQSTRDESRLTGQLRRVFDVVKDGRKRTLEQIAEAADAPHASVSAQLRNLRKPENGNYTVKKEHVGNGLYLYWLEH